MKIKDRIEISGKIRIIMVDIFTGKKTVSIYHNILVNAGKNMMMKRLAGDGNLCNITYVAVGTNATAPDPTDTALGTEIARNLVTAISDSGNTLSITGFFGASEANGVLKELAFFGEAATGFGGVIGTMFNHATISETKTSAKTLSINATTTIS